MMEYYLAGTSLHCTTRQWVKVPQNLTEKFSLMGPLPCNVTCIRHLAFRASGARPSDLSTIISQAHCWILTVRDQLLGPPDLEVQNKCSGIRVSLKGHDCALPESIITFWLQFPKVSVYLGPLVHPRVQFPRSFSFVKFPHNPSYPHLIRVHGAEPPSYS